MGNASTKPACARWRRPIKENPHDLRNWSWVDSMLEWQRDQCALCGYSLRGKGVLDHSHETGLVRGYLCNGCNCHQADYNKAYVGGANPAAMLGVVEIYLNWFRGGFPVMRSDEETAIACFRLAELSFDALPRRVSVTCSPAEMVAARDHLWAREGWPTPAEWRWDYARLT